MDLRLRQLHEAMGIVQKPGLSNVRETLEVTSTSYYHYVDFSGGSSSAELANAVTLYLNNIATIKDHLKAWCSARGIPFSGEHLINTNQDVAIIHDLWNVDKHAKLSRTSRSGLSPQLGEIRRCAGISATLPGETSGIMFNHNTGKMEMFGKVEQVIFAPVVDGQRRPIDNLLSIGTRAIEAWEQLLKEAGVVVPPRI